MAITTIKKMNANIFEINQRILKGSQIGSVRSLKNVFMNTMAASENAIDLVFLPAPSTMR